MRSIRVVVLAVAAVVATAAIAASAFGHAATGSPMKRLFTPDTGTSIRAPARNTTYACFGNTLVRPARPWINRRGVLDVEKRPFVEGAVSWDERFRITLSPARRFFRGNGLPRNVTGVFPVRKGTPAYEWYASLPAQGYSNAAEIPIEPWRMNLSIPRNPRPNPVPRCIARLTTGISKNGAPYHVEIAFDSDLNLLDPQAALPLDRCWGHPYDGQYHLHGPSYACFASRGAFTGNTKAHRRHSPQVGWAIDGFGIFGPRGRDGQIVRNSQLDVCHGHTHAIDWDGRRRVMYHYHLNGQYPYSIGCFRGNPAFLPPEAN